MAERESARIARSERFKNHWQGGSDLAFRTFAAQDRGSRRDQQDSAAATSPEYYQERGMLCVLSDGMGGLSGGEEVSALVVDTMIGSFYDLSPETPPERILLKGCAEAQRRVLARQSQAQESGATLVAILIREGRCSFLSVGDSRICLFRDGGLIPLTRDQNKSRRIETQIALGRLPPEARTDRKRQALSRFIGMAELDQVDRSSRPFALKPGDKLLLMSDGIYRSLSRKELISALRQSGGVAVESLVDQVIQKEKPDQDNCTAALVECLDARGEFPAERNRRVKIASFPEDLRLDVGTAQWRGTRRVQNDVISILDQGDGRGLCAVLTDGIGTEVIAGKAAQAAADAMRKAYDGLSAGRDLVSQTIQIAGSAHHAVQEVSELALHQGGMSTGVSFGCVLARGGRCSFCSVGNVRLFLIRADTMLQLNRDYLLSTEAETSALLEGQEPELRPEWQLSLTSYAGKEGLKELDWMEEPLELIPGDQLLMISSGMYGVLSEEEWLEILQAENAQEAAEKAIARVMRMAQESQSNVSVVLLRAMK